MNRAQLKELVKNIMSEESEYQAFFQKALEKAGKSIPSMSDDEKKAFFNKIDSAWDGKGEKNEGNTFGAVKKVEENTELHKELTQIELQKLKGTVEEKVIKLILKGKFPKPDPQKLLKLSDNHYVAVLKKISRIGGDSGKEMRYRTEDYTLGELENWAKARVELMVKQFGLKSDLKIKLGEKNEGNAFGAAVTAAKKAGEDEFEVGGETYKVEEKLVGGQKKLDVDGDGEIESSDLADLRAGKKADEGMELPKATIPSAVKSKLEMAIDKIKDSNLTYNQKIQVVGQVMDSLGIDKAEFNKMASKLKGTMESVNESRESDILAQIEKLRVAANSGKITGAQFQDKFYPLWKELKTMNKNNESINEENIGLSKGNDNLVMKTLENLIGQDIEYKRKDEKLGKNYYSSTVEFFTKTGFAALSISGTNLNDDFTVKIKDKGFNSLKNYEVEFVEGEKNAIKMAIGLVKKYGKKYFGMTESVNEGVSSTDMDKIKGAVEAANSFMSVGSELKKLGMKYTFATEPLPIYIIQPTPNNKVAIVNKKYATKPDFVVGDIAVGIMESKSSKSVNEGRAFINAARKAKTEGLTEFEFNGKKYPVTIKD
jgi:hypothetical protein